MGGVWGSVVLPTFLLVVFKRGVKLRSENLKDEAVLGVASSGRSIGLWRLVGEVGCRLAALPLLLSSWRSAMVKVRGTATSQLAG
jgi:hypothetical protein